MALLTTARQNLWLAIEADPELKVAFRTKFKFDRKSEEHYQGPPTPGPAQCPALAIYPANSPDGWVMNQVRETQYTLQFAIFTHGMDVLHAEHLWEAIIRALHQRAPNVGVEYWRASDATQNMIIGPLTIGAVLSEPDNPQSPVVTRFDFPVQLTLHWNPETIAQ